IPITDNDEMHTEMNRFLSASRVLEIEQRFYQNDKSAFWSFCVRYLNSNTGRFQQQSKKQKVDYKELLNENEFALFSKLRECRKIFAANDAVPAYAVFTDEELAGIARLPVLEVSKLISVKGIGDKKVEKYGNQLIELFNSSVTLLNQSTLILILMTLLKTTLKIIKSRIWKKTNLR
ncbi:MAG: HRDC domain-containing protein, partial [Bacteroidota bacterium]|nr:HRDC domain-containing protein [Bacteroidota bacterium]